MLTAREQAVNAYNNAHGMGRASVLGADMERVTAARLEAAQRDAITISAAIGSGRYSLREPDDDTLTRMREHIGEVIEQCARDLLQLIV